MSAREYSRRDYTVARISGPSRMVSPTPPSLFLSVILAVKLGIVESTMASDQGYHKERNGTDEKWSGTLQWDMRDSRLDDFPLMSTLSSICVPVLYAIAAGILIKGSILIVSGEHGEKLQASYGNFSPQCPAHYVGSSTSNALFCFMMLCYSYFTC